MKRILAMLLFATLLLGLLVGCGSEESTDKRPVVNFGGDSSADDEPQSPGKPTIPGTSDTDVLEDDSLRYVMIYNPKIYEEQAQTSSADLSTGTFSSQIDVDVNRADALPSEPAYTPYDQELLDPELLDKIDLSGNRGEGLSKLYRVGDTKEFYAYISSGDRRSKATFTCVYVGDHANIWVYGSYDEAKIKNFGKEFDETIYDSCTSAFGEPRFNDKVNLLYYKLPAGLMGCFCGFDLFATGEVPSVETASYGINLDHNILHFNSTYAFDSSYKTAMLGTLAHEFQHLLCFTGYFVAGNQCDVWLNEGMSGYIEELLYPGGKKESGHFASFHSSDRIRYGQSLYNFETGISDIGVYGSVYYFSEYLAKLAGKNVFSKFHDYWRNYNKTGLDESKALYESVSSSVRSSVDQFIEYPSSLSFRSASQEWMSKLVLQFYLAVLEKDSSAPSAFSNIKPQYLLYDKLSGAEIEGGGRIIVAVKGGSFQIPEDADDGLIYIGLDKNFTPVTSFVYR